jgi:hypothetical protein
VLYFPGLTPPRFSLSSHHADLPLFRFRRSFVRSLSVCHSFRLPRTPSIAARSHQARRFVRYAFIRGPSSMPPPTQFVSFRFERTFRPNSAIQRAQFDSAKRPRTLSPLFFPLTTIDYCTPMRLFSHTSHSKSVNRPSRTGRSFVPAVVHFCLLCHRSPSLVIG